MVVTLMYEFTPPATTGPTGPLSLIRAMAQASFHHKKDPEISAPIMNLRLQWRVQIL